MPQYFSLFKEVGKSLTEKSHFKREDLACLRRLSGNGTVDWRAIRPLMNVKRPYFQNLAPLTFVQITDWLSRLLESPRLQANEGRC